MRRPTKREAAIGLILLAVCLLALGAWQIEQRWSLANGKETTGRVLAVNRDEGLLELRYKDRTGARHERTLALEAKDLDGFRRGDSVTLLYRPGEESEAVPVSLNKLPGMTFVLFIAGVGLLGLGGWILVRVPGRPIG